MVARIATVAFQGIEVLGIDVQVQMAGGFAGFHLVGLPDKAVGESRERVRAALAALGLSVPERRITVNLAPADASGFIRTLEHIGRAPCLSVPMFRQTITASKH